MINYNELPMETFERIAVYDLDGMVLNDCTYLSHKETLEGVEFWWIQNKAFIMQAVLEKVQSSEQMQSSDNIQTPTTKVKK